MAHVFGIDLGTTHSLIAHCVEGKPTLIAHPDTGEVLLPSVVSLPAGAPAMVGHAARQRLFSGATDTVASVKRLMGLAAEHLSDSDRLRCRVAEGSGAARLDLAGRLYSAPEVAACILRELKAHAEIVTGGEVIDVVITVPAYFNDSQRQATRDAGRLAGLNVLRLVNEPTAAALAYGLDRRQEGRIAVYDLGGGTFDVSILRLERGLFQVLATHGDTHLGGEDIDDGIAAHLWAGLGEPGTLPGRATQQELRRVAEVMKIQLSEGEHATAVARIDGSDHHLELHRDLLEELAAPVIERSLEGCRRALRDAGLTAAELDVVVLVGGATRMPLVRGRVAEFFGRPPIDDVNPDEVVALGAAVQAGALSGSGADVLLLDVVPLSLGIETVGGVTDRIIERNATVPAVATQVFTTFVDNQTAVDLHVVQGDRELAADNRSLGRFQLTGLQPQPAGVPRIEVTFVIDVNGMLSVSARDQRSGREHGIDVKPTYGITEDEIDRMLAASFHHASDDERARQLVEARNEADTLQRGIRQALRHWEIGGVEAQSIETALANLDRVRYAHDLRAIQTAMEALQLATLPLAERALRAE